MLAGGGGTSGGGATAGGVEGADGVGGADGAGAAEGAGGGVCAIATPLTESAANTQENARFMRANHSKLTPA